MDLMAVLARIAWAMTFLSLLSGFLITAITGSPRLVKYFLAVLNGLAALLAIVILIFFRLFVYLLFQYITVVLALSFLTIFGATLGYGFYLLIHHKPPGIKLSADMLNDYLTSRQFALEEGIDEDRAIARIKSGYYNGGIYNDLWYIQKSELSVTRTDANSSLKGNSNG